MHITSKPQAMSRPWKALLGTALAPLLLVAGCQTNTGTGLLAGGGLGALAGGAIGAATGHAGAGALIGAAAGSTIGGLAGASEDRHEYRQAVRADAERRLVGLQEVVDLTKTGTSDQIIINLINTSGTIYHLTGAQIQWLHDNGVRDPIIETMQATATRPPPVYIRERPVVFVEPPPPVGFGVVIRGGR
jgi:Glycine zipper